jgi:hypothetical protein
MNNEKENSGLFSAGDIERYHKGGMPPAEMHALERAALDDPFLADALEGYAFTSTPSGDISLLQDKLRQRIDQRKGVIPLFTGRTWAKAAAVILVIAAGSWLIVNNFQKKEPGLAMERTAVSPKDSVAEVAAPSLPYSSATADTGFFNDNRNKEISSGRQSSSGKKEQESSNREADQRQVQPATTLASPPSPAEAEDKKNVPEVPSVPSLQKAEGVAANHNPEINPAGNRTMAADKETETSSKQARKLNTESSRADTVKNFNVVMEPNNSLAEVVVLNKGKKTAFSRPEPIIDTLEPEPGWSSYDDYIAANIKTPQQLQIKPQGGTVELSFDINKNGDPVNVQVTKSLCGKCDEEAIRLLKEGPKWKKKKSRKGKIAIQF